MYQLKNIEKEGFHCIELINIHQGNKALFCLEQGGRLDQLILNKKDVLSEMPICEYNEHYASAILFPFANRINLGKYEFNQEKYSLICNEINNKNAIHGLVYNKDFELSKTELNVNYGAINLIYNYDGIEPGFPFKFQMQLTYMLRNNTLELEVTVNNCDQKPFPFTLGWHPYFKSSDLSNSSLNFTSLKKVSSLSANVLNKGDDIDLSKPINLENQKFDEAFILENDSLGFSTPQHDVKLKSSASINYIQLYTPELPNTIAIEPMTGVADSFNNKLGLQILKPSQSYKIRWTISVQSKINQSTNN